jgi:hypothetical protein
VAVSDDSLWKRFLEARRTAPPGIVEVTFDLPADPLPVRRESMWAEQVGPDLFVLRNSPFHVDGVSFLDTVRAELRGAEWFFVGVHARSGHSTFRVRITDRWLRAPWELLFAPLKRFGCTLEGADARWTAVDVPPGADLHAVAKELQTWKKLGRWDFEVAHIGHATA